MIPQPRTRTPAAGPAGRRGPLLERAAQLAQLREAVRAVADRASATVVVHGPPGTGRSALLAEAAAIAQDADLHVIALRCRKEDRQRRHGIARDAIEAAALVPPGAPLALIVDDGQWADPYSAQWARTLTRSSAGRPMLFVVAGHDPRTLEVSEAPRYELELRPLSRTGVRALLVEAYGDRACGSLVPAAVSATGGNPAVLTATLRRFPAPAPEPGELASLADQLGSEQVRRALDGLPDGVAALVRASAVARGDLTFAQVYELAGIREPSRVQARTDLASTGLYGDVERPRLSDPLLADRVLGLMDGPRRRELYVRAVQLGRRDGMGDPVLGRLVSHTHLTEPWVPQLLYAAGRQARRSGDHPQAVAFLQRAVDRDAAGALRAEILLELAMAQSYVLPEAADRAFRQVLAEAAGPDLSASRLVAADLLVLRGGGRESAHALAWVREGAVSTAERRTMAALRSLSLDEQQTLDAAPLGEAPLPATVPDSDGPPERPPADPAQAAAAAWQLCARGQRIDEVRRLATSVLVPGATGDGLFAPSLTAVRTLMLTEDVDTARAGLDRIHEGARRHGVRPAIGLALLTRVEIALRCGDLNQARNLLAETVTEVPRRHWHPRALPRLITLGALIDLESGLPDRAESALATAVPEGHEQGPAWTELQFARGVLDLYHGRTASATTRLRECGRLLLNAGCLNPAVLPWRSHLAMVTATASPEDAARLLGEDLSSALAWGAPGMLGAVHLWSGLTIAGPTGLRHLESAVRVLGDSSARSRHRQAMVELAAVLLETGRPADGSRMLADAMAAMVREGTGRPTPRAERVAREYAASARAARVRLTPAQLRVALLAAEGRPNKAIAAELSISVRAVELHLTHTYRALGISGRADLAASLGH